MTRNKVGLYCQLWATKPRDSHNSSGFTIAEMLIATVVFGVILLVIATSIIQFTRVYYKGITESNTQTVARDIMDGISQGIQFNGGNITDTVSGPGLPAYRTPYAFCVGNTQYSYALGTELSDSPTGTKTPHALLTNNVAGCSSSTPPQPVLNASATGRELLSPNMRLSNLAVKNIGPNVYSITVSVVYGDDDILTNPTTTAANCNDNRLGTQFCATSTFTTVVTKRVQ